MWFWLFKKFLRRINKINQIDHVGATFYQKAADCEQPLAFNNFGVLYEKGLGVEQNYSKDFEYYNKAANLGEPLAFNNLCVEQDFSNSIEFYEKVVDFDCLNLKSVELTLV